MKIDFGMLDKLEAAGATAKVIIEMLRTQHAVAEAKRVTKRPKDAKRQRERRGATKSDKPVTPSDTERHEATLSDTPRARLFREGKGALLTLNISDNRAGGLMSQWLKLTNDDDQLVLATILKAQSLAVADAPGWILATLKGKTNGNGTSADRTAASAGNNQSGSAAIAAGVAAAAERRGRERAAARPSGQAPRDADAASEPDFGFGGTGHR